MKKRMITAIIGIPLLVLSIISFEGLFFFILIALFSVLALKEYCSITLSDESRTNEILTLFLGGVILLGAFLENSFNLSGTAQGGSTMLPAAGLVFGSFVLFFYHICRIKEFSQSLTAVFKSVFGLFYVAFLFSYLIVLRYHPEGANILLFLLFVTWAGDTGGYFIGRWKGRHALSPRISPKKTVEGMFGSAVFGIVLALACKFVFLKNTALLHCLVMGMGVNILNQCGDLFESLIKRTFGVKDSGGIIPGHGGVLDRVDSLLFAAPFIYYYTYFFNIA